MMLRQMSSQTTAFIPLLGIFPGETKIERKFKEGLFVVRSVSVSSINNYIMQQERQTGRERDRETETETERRRERERDRDRETDRERDAS